MITSLVQPLFEGSLDIVGDVHGEVGALKALIGALGYEASGAHPDGRHLVFVGDLIDRGPDSPAVVKLVRQLIESGHAQGILGNHELNLVHKKRKAGNHWFFGDAERTGGPGTPDFESVLLDDEGERAALLSFFGSLPLALEREDLRVVHAQWEEAAIKRVRGQSLDSCDVAGTPHPEDEEGRTRLAALGAALHDASRMPAYDPLLARFQERKQKNSVTKLLTSGAEIPITGEEPFFGGGSWRFVQRDDWWSRYRGTPVVVGHYWRPRTVGQKSTLPQVGPEGWWGDIYCIDYCVGRRFEDRANGVKNDFKHALAALRWPEQEVVFDDGTRVQAALSPGRR